MRANILAGAAGIFLLSGASGSKAADSPCDRIEIGELFKIRRGKIKQIEALVLNVPYGMPTGWGKKQQ
ncbi:MAG TPA: hypothetical protein VHZ74_23725 [Bryobacteraceae bacterium]|jgi:hypothetical protein|nr:hypothetical protein [Bryobacteraceae bacterium]